MKTILCSNDPVFKNAIKACIKTTFIDLFDFIDEYSVVILDAATDDEVRAVSKIKNIFKNVVVICIASSNEININAFIYGCDSLLYKDSIDKLPSLIKKWKEYLSHKKLINNVFNDIYNGTVTSNG